MAELNEMVTVVTGASSGIGRGIATLFTRAGGKVVLVDIDESGADLARDLGPGAVFRRGDVTDESDVAGAVDLAVGRFGRLDTMINNAGRGGQLTFLEDVEAEEWDSMFALLARSVMFGVKHAARVMRPQGSGCILATSSVAALQTGFSPHAYGAAKAAVIALVRSAAMELAPNRVRVNAIVPGGIDTSIVRNDSDGAPVTEDVERRARVRARLADLQPIPRVGEPEDIAGAAAYLAGPGGEFVTGQTLVIDGGLVLGREWGPPLIARAERAAKSRAEAARSVGGIL
jgi:NAD(P)-dependent dehydrogenase (short-subunit alcohol dehydrogenase family)